MPSPSRSLDQVRAVNANLTTSPTQYRAAEDRRSAERKAADAERRATHRSHVAYLRAERDGLRADLRAWDNVEADIRADPFFASAPATLQGALEELESMRETKTARLDRITSDLRRAGR